MREKWVALTIAVLFAGCQAPSSSPDEMRGAEGQKAPQPSRTVSSAAKPQQVKSQASPAKAPEKKKLGPKTTAESFDVVDGTKIVSGTVLRIMRFAVAGGKLTAEKPPKGIRFSLEGEPVQGYYPRVTLSVYDATQKKWRDLETLTVKGKVEKRYPLTNIPAGLVTFHVAYGATDPAGGPVRPQVFVKSVELDF